MTKECIHCGGEYTPKNKDTKYCSISCSNSARDVSKMPTINCPTCGTPFRKKRSSIKFCSVECRRADDTPIIDGIKDLRPKEKVCNSCKETKDATQFQTFRRVNKHYTALCLAPRCRDCSKERTKEYNNRQVLIGENSYSLRKVQALKRKYNISVEFYDSLRMEQGNKCAICKDPFSSDASIHTDHDHNSGLVAGLLCSKCNQAIGLLREDETIVETALSYVKNRKTSKKDDQEESF